MSICPILNLKSTVIDGEYKATDSRVLSSHPSRCIRIGYDLLNGCRDEAALEIKAIGQKKAAMDMRLDVGVRRGLCSRTEGCIRAVMALVINVRIYHKNGRYFKVFVNQTRVLKKQHKFRLDMKCIHVDKPASIYFNG